MIYQPGQNTAKRATDFLATVLGIATSVAATESVAVTAAASNGGGGGGAFPLPLSALLRDFAVAPRRVGGI